MDYNQGSVLTLEMSILLFIESEPSVGAFNIHVLPAVHLFKTEL